MAWLGFIYIVIFVGVFIGIPAYIGYRRRPVVMRNERRRQIEAAMHRAEYDRQLIEDVADEWGYDPRYHRRRR